jgi:hypothetical protein
MASEVTAVSDRQPTRAEVAELPAASVFWVKESTRSGTDPARSAAGRRTENRKAPC